MIWVRAFLARWRGAFRRPRDEEQLADEVRFHLEERADEYVAAGMTREEAQYTALRSFGGVEAMKETYRERQGLPWVENAVQDVRYALRALAHSPAFAIPMLATLALAICAGTVMFGVLQAVVLRQLPFPAPEQLTIVSLGEGRSAYWNVESWRAHSRSFSDLAVLDTTSVTLTGIGDADRIGVARVSPNFVPMLGVQAAHGRAFTSEEAEQRRRVALITHAFWQSRFGGSLDAIGASLELDGRRSEVIGILPAGFRFADVAAEVWEPHTAFADWDVRRVARGTGSWFVLGRLRANVTLEQANGEMNSLARRLDEEMPAADRDREIRVIPLSEHFVGARSRLAVWMLSTAVVCVVLIAVANVLSLSLARNVSRTRELAVRSVLGASPLRLLRQLVVESVVISAIAGVCGALAAWTVIQLLRANSLSSFPRMTEVTVDGRVLACATALALFAGILTAVAPSITAWRSNLRVSMQSGGRSVSGSQTIRRALVVAEFALAMVLVFGAGILIRSWQIAEDVDPGFQPQQVLSIQLRAPATMPSSQRVAFYQSILERAERTGGVDSAGFISELYITSTSEQFIETEGKLERIAFRRDEASPGFFRAVGTPLRSGRDFAAEDRAGSQRVVIVNQAMASRLWPGQQAVGKRLRFGGNGEWFTVIGVAGNMRRQGPEQEPMPQIFEAIAQNPPGAGYLLAKAATGDPTQITRAIRAAIHEVEPQAPLYNVRTLESSFSSFLAARRLQTFVVAAFSAVAMFLAATGIYGLMQYCVATRTREFGIRMAVGAGNNDILRVVVSEGLRLSVTGLALGFFGALWVGRLSASLLFEVRASDPITLALVPLLLAFVAVVSCLLPALRATRIQPLAALRQE